MKNKILIGITLFSMFFGAGNLIFPPHLGAQAGTSLWPAFAGLAVSAVGLRYGVGQLRDGAGKRVACSCRNLRIRLVLAGFQSRGGHHRFERGPRRIQLRSGSVEHRIGGVLGQHAVVAVRLAHVMAGQLVRVVAGRADHGEDTAGFRLDGHCGAIRAAEAVVCGLLNLRIDGRFDIGALVLLPGEQRLEPLPEQLLRLARQQRAAGRFDAAPATLADGEESGDWRIQFAGGIGTLLPERIDGRIGLCDDRSVPGEKAPARRRWGAGWLGWP